MASRPSPDRPRLRRPASLISLFAVIAAVACSDDPAAPPPSTSQPPFGPAVGVALSPSGLAMRVREAGRLTARAHDAMGRTVPAVFSWSSADPTLATVNDEGLVTGIAVGTTTVTVAAGSLQASAEVEITQSGDLVGTIAFTRMNRPRFDSVTFDVLLYSLTSGQLQSVPRVQGGSSIAAPAWSPDGAWLALEVIDSLTVMDLGEDGLSIDYSSDIYILRADAPLLPWRALTHDGRSRSPSWSPDGSRIAYLAGSRQSNDEHIYVLDVNTGASVRITSTAGHYSTPKWSPDGQQLAFADGLGGNSDVFIADTDSSQGEVRNLTPNPAYDADPSWSPDGSRLAFVSDRPDASGEYSRDVFILSLGPDGVTSSRVTSGGWNSGPVWSSDGRHLAFAHSGSPEYRHGIFVADADGSGLTRLTTAPITGWDGAAAWISRGMDLASAGTASVGVPLRSPGLEQAASSLLLEATMQFGQLHVGSPFPPAADHDQSAHAKDNLVPGTVVIDRGGTVTFNVPAGAHQIAIYAPDTKPEDIDTGALVRLCPGTAARLINDTRNRIALITSACGAEWQAQYTFDTPGRYLVICAFLPHFQVGMYGWVEVRDRE